MLFQVTLVVMGVAAFSFVFSSLYSTAPRLAAGSMMPSGLCIWRGDRFWLLGYTLLFLDPGLILFSVGLLAVGLRRSHSVLVYFFFVIRSFPRSPTRGRVLVEAKREQVEDPLASTPPSNSPHR